MLTNKLSLLRFLSSVAMLLMLAGNISAQHDQNHGKTGMQNQQMQNMDKHMQNMQNIMTQMSQMMDRSDQRKEKGILFNRYCRYIEHRWREGGGGILCRGGDDRGEFTKRPG